MSGHNSSLNNNIFSQHYYNSNNGNVSSEYIYLNIHTLSQYKYSSTFKNIDNDVEMLDADLSSGYGYKIFTLYPDMKIQVHLRTLMGLFTRVLLLVDMVL